MQKLYNSSANRRQPGLLGEVRDAIRTKHYSIRTEEAYVHWIRRFILFHDKRHPRDMGVEESANSLPTLPLPNTLPHRRKTRR